MRALKIVGLVIVGLLIVALLGFLGWRTYQSYQTAPVNDTVPAVVAPAPTAPVSCIDTATAKLALGADVQRIDTEPCSWQLRNANGALTKVVIPEGWVATLDVANSTIKVVEGHGQSYMVKAMTARYKTGFDKSDAVWDLQKLFEKERAFAQKETPSFVVTIER